MNKAVEEKIRPYPEHIKPKMEQLRELIFQAAKSTSGVAPLFPLPVRKTR